MSPLVPHLQSILVVPQEPGLKLHSCKNILFQIDKLMSYPDFYAPNLHYRSQIPELTNSHLLSNTHSLSKTFITVSITDYRYSSSTRKLVNAQPL